MQTEQFDVFLSHNSLDKPLVEQIARRLVDEAKLRPFLDKWHLTPGEPWQPALENALGNSKTVAFFIGPTDSGPWHHEELQVALMRAGRERKEFRVIPVLLPNADASLMPAFLQLRTWVDFREGISNDIAFNRLVAGILGRASEFKDKTLPAIRPNPTMANEAPTATIGGLAALPTSAEPHLGQSAVARTAKGKKRKTAATLAGVAVTALLLLWGLSRLINLVVPKGTPPPVPNMKEPERFTLHGHEKPVSIAFTPNSQYLVSWDDFVRPWSVGGQSKEHDSTIRLWDVHTGKEIELFHSSSVRMNSLVIAPDGKTIAAAMEDGSARIWTVPNGNESVIHREPEQTMTSVAFSPDSARLAVGTDKGIIRIFDWKAKRQIAECKGHGGSIIRKGFTFSKNGSTLISASRDDSIRVWDTATGNKQNTIPDLEDIWGVHLTHDPNRIVVFAKGLGGENYLHIVDLVSGKTIKTFPRLWVDDTAISADGKIAYKICDSFYLHAFDLDALTEVCQDKNVRGSRFVFLPEPASRMLVVRELRLLVYKVDGFTFAHIRTEQEHSKPILSVTASADGALVATGDESGTIKLWNAKVLSQEK